MQQPTSARRFPAIDGLRGVLVLLVVFHHVHLRFVLTKLPVAALLPKPVARVMFWSGYYAVVMFFVVSGFLITHHSLRRWQTLPRMELPAFYWLRFTRIYPCLLLLLVVLSCLHALRAPGYVIDPQKGSLGRAVLAALAFHVNWLEGTRGYLPGAWDVLWSLSVEEAFYLVFPLMCWLARRESVVVCLLLVPIALGPVSRSLTLGDDPWNEYAYLSCLDAIAFGCLAAWSRKRAARKRVEGAALSGKLGASMLALGLGCVLFVLVARETVADLGLVEKGLHVSVLAFGTALVLWSAVELHSSARRSWLQVIGECSYEIYLTHMFVVLAAPGVFKASGASLPWVFAFYVATALLSVALGFVVARYYGAPLAAALRKRALRTRRAPA
ncbi:MAG TPA: acyltransferase [Polyangiales bacterium]|nr:acyltransferase [Polyangiales bacterium]